MAMYCDLFSQLLQLMFVLTYVHTY